MEIKFKKEWMEYGILLITLGLLLWLGPGRIWDHKIDHGYPYAHAAQDAFQHQSRSAGIAHLGSYKYEPIQYFTGDNPTFPGYYPPILVQLGAALSLLTGLETYITVQGLVFFSALGSAALAYFLIRDFNKRVALLSLSSFLFIFAIPAASNGFTWGNWPQIFGQIFLLLIAWSVIHIDNKGWGLLLLGGLVGTILTYTGHTIMGGIFLFIFILWFFAKRGTNYKVLMSLVIIGILTFIVTFHFAVMFKNIWMPMNPFTLSIKKDWQSGGGIVRGSDFGIFWWGIIIGAIISAIRLLKGKKNDIGNGVLLFALVMMGMGFTNYVGFGKRAFFIRLLWPIYLSVFVGLTIDLLMKFISQRGNTKWSTHAAGLLGLLCLIVTFIAIPRLPVGEGITNQQSWDALTWLRDSTPPDARIIFFYGDNFLGDNMWNVERYNLRIQAEDYIQALQNLSVRRHYIAGINTDAIAYFVIPPDLKKEGKFNWGWKWNLTYDYRAQGYRDICNAEYLVFARVSRQPVLAQYNMYIASELLKKSWVSEAFVNDYVLILKNDMPGETCIENHQIQPNSERT